MEKKTFNRFFAESQAERPYLYNVYEEVSHSIIYNMPLCEFYFHRGFALVSIDFYAFDMDKDEPRKIEDTESFPEFMAIYTVLDASIRHGGHRFTKFELKLNSGGLTRFFAMMNRRHLELTVYGLYNGISYRIFEGKALSEFEALKQGYAEIKKHNIPIVQLKAFPTLVYDKRPFFYNHVDHILSRMPVDQEDFYRYYRFSGYKFSDK